ncbi:MAG: hypothetical protein L6R48_18140, partial [Planctomycetes bacterium]|nr:hypothetical protein [Planctomycetota bacterium]
MRIPILLLTAGLAAGVDQRVQDLRAEGELRPLRVQATWSDAQGAAGVDAGLDRAWAAGAGLRWGG